ncbi:glutathione S-transferase-related transmembrane protein [alpha proteobacterium U9-1i]|nr:glutathione S-transferase-related transmembrane protein [alpha proteobacterium U9-1i]
MSASSIQLKNSQLKVELPSDREVRVTRAFAAPAQLVWDAHTKPELVKRWMLGPDGWSMPVCEIDLRVGGAYRYRWRNDADGSEFGSSGIHKEVVTPTRIVTTERMEGFQGEAMNTMVLHEAGGKTVLTLTMDFGSKEARDGAVATGMTDGMELGYQRLDTMFAA